MTNSTVAVGEFLASTPPFDRLSLQSKKRLIANSQLLRYRLGQTIAVRDAMSANISILYSGQARLLAYTPGLPHKKDEVGWGKVKQVGTPQ